MTNINVTLLKQFNSELKNEYDNFVHSSYNSFLNSYIESCSDPYIKQISNKLDSLYKKINSDYENLNNWFESYITNIDSLEKYLSGDTGYSKISEDSVRNFVYRNLTEVISENNNAYNKIDAVSNRKNTNDSDFEGFNI